MFNIRAEVTPGSLPTLLIADHIGPSDVGGGITVEFVQKFLQQNANAPAIRVVINSAGGQGEAGIAIYEALKRYRGIVHTVGDDIVASAAAIIFLAGSVRELTEGSNLMIHHCYFQFSGETILKEPDLLSMNRQAYELNRRMERIISGRTGQTREVVSGWMNEEKWFDAREALKYGFVTGVTAASATSAGTTADLSRFKNVPDALRKPSRETTVKAPTELDSAVAILNKYTVQFGAKAAAKYLTAGLSYPQALERHGQMLKAKVQTEALRANNAELEVEFLKSQMRLLEPFRTPRTEFSRRS